MTTEKTLPVAPVHEIVTRLRERSAGKDMWRVRDKDTGAYCIQFEAWEQIEAHEWWRDHKDREFHKNHELARVRIQSQEDRLMQEAADMLEFFFGQMQMHSPKMELQVSREWLANDALCRFERRGRRESGVAGNPAVSE